MKMKKILIFMFVLMVSLFSVNAVTLFEDNFDSVSLNTSYWTVTGGACGQSSGTLNCDGGSGWGVDGVQGSVFNYQDYTNVSIEFTTSNFNNPDDQAMFGYGDNSGINYVDGEYMWYPDGSSAIKKYEDGGAVLGVLSLSDNIYNFRIDVINGGTAKYYYKLNSSSTWILNGTSSKSPSDTSMSFLFAHKMGLRYIDDFIIYSNGVKTPITSPTLEFTNITANNITLVNNTFYNSSINFETFVTNILTNSDVNHSYILGGDNKNIISSQISITNITSLVSTSSLNIFCLQQTNLGYISHDTNANGVSTSFWNGSVWITQIGQGAFGSILCGSEVEIQYATNSLNGSVNLNLIENNYNISFLVENNETNVTSDIFDFIMDETPPVIDVLLNLTTDSFGINFSNVINVTDNLSGLASCTINITYLESVQEDSNFFINCTDTQLFTRAGLYNGFVTAEDNAGNINTLSANGTINPIISIFFNDSSGGGIIFNYTSTIFHPDGDITYPTVNIDGSINLSPVNNDSLDLGVHIIQFEKDSFSTTNFTVNVTIFSSGENITFNVSLANINISIFNRFDNSIITDLVNIQIIGPVGITSSTSTGILNINSTVLVPGSYELIATSSNFFTESIFFTYTNEETLELNVFLLNNTQTNKGQIGIFVKNNFEELQPNILLKLLEYDNVTNAFTDISQTETNLNGVGFFNVELGKKKYVFRAISGDVIADSSINGEFIYLDGDSRTLLLRVEGLRKLPNLKNFVFDVNENETARDINISNIVVTWDDSSNLVNKVCIRYFKKTGVSTIFLTEFCDTGSSGTLESNVLLNLSENSIIANVDAFVDNSVYPLDSFTYLRSSSTQSAFESLGFLDYIILAIFALAIGIGIMMDIPALGATAVILLSGFLVSVFPSWISGSLAALITLICLGIIYSGVRKE